MSNVSIGSIAGAPDLHGDAGHLRLSLLRFVFVRRRPARMFGRASQFVLLGKRVDLNDEAVDVVIEFSAFVLPHVDEQQYILEG